MDIESQLHVVSEIDSKAELETLETFEERIHHYKDRRYTYIPMPTDGMYFNIEEGWTKDIDSSQYVKRDMHLMEALRKLQKQPFLLVDHLADRTEYLPKSKALDAGVPEDEVEVAEGDVFDDSSKDAVVLRFNQLENYFPDIAEEKIEDYERTEVSGVGKLYRYGIINLADINRRPVKVMLYKVFSELSSRISGQIEDRYSDPESILKLMRPVTIGRWKKDQLKGLELHISEHMNLLDMMQVIQSSDTEFVESCGFSSKSDVEKLNSINEVRNRVMHANRSLIYNRRDIQDILDKVNTAQTIINNIE